MFDNRKQSVPKLFLDKIAIDKIIDPMKKSKIVSFSEMIPALKKQKELRRKCEIFCLSRQVEKDGGGTPAGGTVFKPKKLEAIAA